MSEERRTSALVRVTGLWSKSGGNGQYLGGSTKDDVTIPAGSHIMVFLNTKRETEKQPTHEMKFAPPQGIEAPQNAPQPAATEPDPFEF